MKVSLHGLMVLGLAAGILSGCASTKQLVSLPVDQGKVDNPEMSRIYVMRPSSFGGSIPMSVFDGEKKVGSTGPNGCLAWERPAEKTEIIGKAENSSVVALEPKKGEMYYILQRVEMGFLFARNKLELLSDEKGREMAKKCKFAENTK